MYCGTSGACVMPPSVSPETIVLLPIRKGGHSYCHESLSSRAGFAGQACIGQGCAAHVPRFIRYDTKDAQDLLGELVIVGRIVSIGMSDDQSAQPQQCTCCRGQCKLRIVNMENSGADCRG